MGNITVVIDWIVTFKSFFSLHMLHVQQTFIKMFQRIDSWETYKEKDVCSKSFSKLFVKTHIVSHII